ncbi:uncharacterized protein LOC124407011 [Diprion similis]|uniref:uncharacterized protein LOC124407011 n=1 Tax=Diprion similis TaxID=362088 RepID=UPI001EF8647E|nr:uncharacterized protein LOC124407011 [Diprion similis]
MAEKNEGTKRCDSEKVQEVFTISFHTEESQPVSVIVPDESESPRDFEEAIEATGYGLYNVLLLLAALPGAWANLFDTTAISYVLPTAECDLKMTLFQKGLLNAAIYAGMFTAAFPWGVLADTKGRKTLLMIGYLADCICNVLSSMSQSFYVMLAFKFLSGCIMSGPFAVNMTYLAEFHGAKYRSKMLLWARLFPSLGSIVLPGLAWMILPQSWSFVLFDGVFVYNSWRIFILICSLPAFLGFLALFFFPESPRFLISQGRNDEAMKVFKKMYTMNTGKPPETFPVKELYLETQKKQTECTLDQSSMSVWEKTRSGWSQIKPLFCKPYVSQFVLMTTIQFGGLLGMNTLRLWMPQLFTLMENFNYENRDDNLGPATLCEMLTSPEPLNATNSEEFNSTIGNACVIAPIHSRVYINSIILAVTTVLGCTLAGSLVNLVGKKNLLLLVYIAPAACSFSLNWSPSSDVTLAIFSIYLMFTSIAVTSIISFTVDLMPTSLRATAVSLTMSIGRIGSMIGNLLFPLLLSTGCMVPFIFVGGFLLVCFVLSIFIPKPPEKLIASSNLYLIIHVNDTIVITELQCSGELNTLHEFDEAIEATGYGLFNVLLILAILPGAWANFFDTTVMSYVLPIAECDLQITPFQKGMLNAAVYAGMFTAAFPWGVLADTKGRRLLLMVGYSCDCICNILSSMSQSFYVLLTFKFLSGCIMSGPYAVNMTYLAEFHSGKYRSKVVLWARLFPSLGSIALPGLAWIIIPQPWSFTLFNGMFVYNSWRIFILICSMPALLGFIALLFLPESPRFLMSQGRNEEAIKVFQRIYAMNTGKSPEKFPVKALRRDDHRQKTEAADNPRRVSVWEQIRNGAAQVKPLFQKPYFYRFLLIVTIQFGGLLSLNTVRLWMPQLFTLMEDFEHRKSNGDFGPSTLCNMISTPSNANSTKYDEFNSTLPITCTVVPVYSKVYINSMILAITIVIACSLAGSFVNRIGKRNLLLVAFLIPAVCAFSLNWSPNSDVTLTLLAIYMASGNISITTIISFTVELMPTTLRATAVTLTMAAGRIGAMFGNLLFPLLLSVGCMAPFIFVGGFLLACFILSIFIPKPPSRLT